MIDFKTPMRYASIKENEDLNAGRMYEQQPVPKTWQEFMSNSGYMPVVINSIERHLMPIGPRPKAITIL